MKTIAACFVYYGFLKLLSYLQLQDLNVIRIHTLNLCYKRYFDVIVRYLLQNHFMYSDEVYPILIYQDQCLTWYKKYKEKFWI